MSSVRAAPHWTALSTATAAAAPSPKTSLPANGEALAEQKTESPRENGAAAPDTADVARPRQIAAL